MTTHAPMARVPFAPLDNPRLQHLANAKNRQNGASVLSGKPVVKNVPSTAGKRSIDVASFDGENVDPAVFASPAKKPKSSAFELPSKPFTFSVPARRFGTPKANMTSPRTPMTAPAGRSPPRKMAFKRRTSAPFSRIDPPFASRSTLPFSLDAAISSTVPSATIQESMPKTWSFTIHEDTPEEEAANLMEHSTATLDLSSDEESSKAERNDRGKENTPPEGYDAPTASRKRSVDDMDDGQRTPLSDLETDPFIPAGLDKSSHVLIDDKAVPFDLKDKAALPFDVTDLFGSTTGNKDEIVVFEEKVETKA